VQIGRWFAERVIHNLVVMFMRSTVRSHPLTSFFGLAVGVTWIFWAPYVLSMDGAGLLPYRFPPILGQTQYAGLLGGYLGPLAAALAVTAATEGRTGLHHWRQRLFRWRVGWRWYVAVLLGFPAALLLCALSMPGAIAEYRPPTAALLLYVPYLIFQFFATALAEEPGWRDFALVRLQRRYRPVRATLVLGVLWTTWHLPLFLVPSWAGPRVDLLTVGNFAAMTILFSYLITWVFNASNGSLPLIMLLHATSNTFGAFAMRQLFPGLEQQAPGRMALTFGVLAVAVIVATRGRLGNTTAKSAANRMGEAATDRDTSPMVRHGAR
jgi:membrane protease YdiL (CAAX protease family)